MNSIDISSDRQINISNALFVVDPVPFQFNFKTVDQKEVYINYILSSELNDEELSNALLELDWNDHDTIKLLQEQFLQPWMHQVERAEIHAKCMLRLNIYYPSIFCTIFDKLMDNFYSTIEVRVFVLRLYSKLSRCLLTCFLSNQWPSLNWCPDCLDLVFLMKRFFFLCFTI